MRTLKGQPYPHNTDYAQYKQGTLQNETDTQPGTPVIEEIYGDVLTNIYKLLEEAGITPNQNQDSEDNGFQLVEALQKLYNVFNDVEQTLTLAVDTWSVPFNIDALPNKFVFVARATENYTPGINYTFQGTGSNTYPFTSPSGFKSGDELLVIIDQSAVRAYTLQFLGGTAKEAFTVFGTPVAYNDTNTLYYQAQGNLTTDAPSIHYLQQQIWLFESDSQLTVYDSLVLKGHVLCYVYDAANTTYKLYQFALANLNTPTPIAIEGATIATGTNYNPYIFTDGEALYLTNASGNRVEDYELDKFSYNPSTAKVTYIQNITLANTYQKTTNTVVQGDTLTTFVAGRLVQHNLVTGLETFIGQFNTLNGLLFQYNGQAYYTNGSVAKQWAL